MPPISLSCSLLCSPNAFHCHHHTAVTRRSLFNVLQSVFFSSFVRLVRRVCISYVRRHRRDTCVHICYFIFLAHSRTDKVHVKKKRNSNSSTFSQIIIFATHIFNKINVLTCANTLIACAMCMRNKCSRHHVKVKKVHLEDLW